MLAGGLTADNVVAAIERVRPWGVDVATGVERAPGLKDAVKMREFISNAKAAGARVRPADDDGSYPDNAPYDWEEDFLS